MTTKDMLGNDEDCWTTMGLSDNASSPSHQQLTSEMASLSQTIEGEIIPRLLFMFDATSGSVQMSTNAETLALSSPYTGDVEEFVDLILNHTIEVSTQYMTTLVDNGARLKNVYLDLLAPAARLLGTMWEEDTCNFTQVTVGVARMHQLLHMFSPVFCAHQSTDANNDHSALIVPMPGEQHTFGHIMVVEFFRREGWNVWSGSPATNDEIIDIIAEQPFDIVGLSISADRHLDQLATLIENIRSKSVSKSQTILLGGRVFLESNLDPKSFGADGFASDGEEAVQIANSLC